MPNPKKNLNGTLRSKKKEINKINGTLGNIKKILSLNLNSVLNFYIYIF